MHVWMDPQSCRGCLRCELACSFHKSGHRFFNPEISSTRVYRDNESKRMTMTIDGGCDGCAEEAAVLCVQQCVFGARGVGS